MWRWFVAQKVGVVSSEEQGTDDLMAFVGRELRSQVVSKDAVNVAMIRHWVEAMADDNPIHLADESARASGRPGVVAPATMVQAWPMAGYAASVNPEGADPRLAGADELLACLAEHGYTSVVATDSEFEFERELVPGDRVTLTEVVEDISAEKTTALGVGRFVTSLKVYRDADDEVVATQRWRTLRFRPPAAEAARPAPSELRPRPAVNRDNEFWFAEAMKHRLVVQRCRSCTALRHPPGPCCPECNSYDWDVHGLSGRGKVYSFVISHHPPHPAFVMPLLVALVELDEGVRMVANLVGVAHEDVTIGMPVALEWLDLDPELTLPAFRPDTEED